MIRLLIVDDHPIVRSGLVAAMDGQSGIEVVGAAGSGSEALLMAARLLPCIILLDLEMPGAGGISVLPELLRAAPNTRVLVFTAYDSDELVHGALDAGAAGYLIKGAPIEEIVRALHAVRAGGAYLAARVAKRLFRTSDGSRFPPASTVLSERETQVLRRVAEGLANKQIAAALHITERTVKFHLSSVFTKLGADNRAQAVALAVQRGFLDIAGT